MNWKKIKEGLKKTWDFLWNDNSWQSWVVSIIVAFIVIKFLLLPGIGLIFGTKLPIVAVVSGSMEHRIVEDQFGIKNMCGKKYSEIDLFIGFDDFWNECGQWYENEGISKQKFETFSFKNGFNKGDIMFLQGVKPEKVKIGDVIVFQSRQRPEPIIHRAVKIEYINGSYNYQTKGDHNGISGPVDMNIGEDQLYGKAWFKIPFLGYVKIIAADIFYSITGKQLPI